MLWLDTYFANVFQLFIAIGTHLYVLYEGYGYSVASLYCLGFITGAVTTPLTGPLVDKFGRKKAALLYCFLEVGINMLEQYPFLTGLIASRMVGGITTNLLSSVFETWLDTEYRARGFDEEKYEIIMRDSVIVSNTAAIASGYLAHVLAEKLGPVGPFEGAVGCTVIAFGVVMVMWTENYGSVQGTEDGNSKSVQDYLIEAIDVFKSDSRVLRVGIIQGLTVGSLQIFIFLWSPTLQNFAKNAPAGALGLDSDGEPAYGLIFGAFMAAGVLGGLCSPFIRKAVTVLLTPLSKGKVETINIEGEGEIRPMAVEFLTAFCYIMGAFLLMVPCLVAESAASSFTSSLVAFIILEFTVGVSMPCEGVIRSLYIPSDARATMMTLPRMIVNIAVSVGVVSTTLFRYVFEVKIRLQISSSSLSYIPSPPPHLQQSNRFWSCRMPNDYGGSYATVADISPRLEQPVWQSRPRASIAFLHERHEILPTFLISRLRNDRRLVQILRKGS